MLSAVQIAGFLNQAFLQRKSMKQPRSLHIDTNLQKLKVDRKVFGGAWSKMSKGQSAVWTIKLTVSQENIDGSN